ncbi:MAG: condensation domain-containing protein [Chloroflexota bacterium]
MIPSAFVMLDVLPLSAHGKVNRKALPEPEFVSPRIEAKTVEVQTPTEQLLAEIWQDVLGLEMVGREDNFFEIGGDSISSLQVVSRAQAAGIHLTFRQIFEAQTVAGLAQRVSPAAASAEKSQAEVNIPTGNVLLTPIQRRFFAQPHANLNHVNQSLFIAGEKSLQPELLCQALAYLMQQHDALRLRFKPVSAAGRTFWTQFYAEVTDELESELTSNDVMLEGWLNQIRPSVHMLDLAHLSPDEQQIALEQKNHELQINLNITSGPVWQVASVHLGSDQPDRLLFVIHHLMVDWVSWRILMADLWTIYEQLLAQKTVQLPPKSTSFEQWSTTLHHHAHSPEVLGELDYWVNSRARSVSPLPTDQPFKAEEETLASVETVTCHLSAEETKALLQHVPAVYHTHINDLLMTALVQAFAAWQNAEQDYYCLLLDLERHGREDLDEQIDLSSTVGWFTSIFPLCLELNRGKLTSNPGAAIKSVKEQLRRVPGNGIGYGLLRYLNPESAPLLAALPQAEITFNYGGQFQDGQMDSLGGDRDVGEPLGYRMRIDGGILGDQLLLAWSYSHNLYKRETIERLAQGYIDALSTLIGHCLMPDAGGYTPSDFPDVTIVQAQLDRIVEHIHEMADSAESPRDKAEAKQSIEAIYPLSPSQQGLLFDTLSQKMLTSPTTLGENQPTKEPTGKYLEIFTYDLQGKLDAKAFQQAWQAVVARHPALRTGFYWDGLAEPLQFVLPDIKISIPYQDWQTRSEVEQQTQLQQHLAELHEAGFDMTSPPLMHFALFQVAEDRHIFVWGAHHILKDGWCTQLILGEVIALYEAQREGQQSAQQGELLMSVLPPAPTYQTYIQWLQQQDMGRSERFWRERLSGFDQATPLGEPTQRPAEVLSANHSTNEVDDRTEEKRFGDAYQILSTEVTDSLQTIMRQNHLTLNALVQGTWAILLSRYSGQEDVLFGATVSGRPPTIRQVESIVGLFINTVPVRVAVQPEQPLLDWLQIRQSQALEEDAYAFCSAGQIHGWSDVRGSQPLFESILVFQNYPKMAQSGEGEMGENAAVKAKNAENALTLDLIPIPGYGARTQYALTLQIVTTETLFIQAIYDKLRLSQTDVELILVHWATLLVSIAENPTQTVMQLCNQIPTEQIPTMYPTGRSQESVTYVHPRTAQEQQLVTIWEALLGVQSIGVHDNFFALGGHSLLAMELATRLQETFSHPMPLNLILQYPTVEALSAFLAKSADAHQTGVHHSNTPQNGATNGTTKGRSNDPWISLIALQPNGHKAPFFCVPGVEGNPLYLHSLAQCVGADQPFYALQAIGLDGVTSPHESIEAEAAHYIAEIRQMQQHGPYYVGGHSRGGRVAYAMAQQLKKEGEEIGLLAVMDSGWPGLLDEELANLDDVTFIMSMVDHFSGYQFSNNEAAPRPTMGHIQGEVEIEPTLIGPYLDKQADIYRVLHRLSSEEQFIWLQQQLEALKIIPPGVNKSWVHGLFHVYKNNIRTDCAYQPKPNHSGIKIALFAAQERDAQASKQLDREKQGSGKYAHGTRKKEPSGELLSADELVSGWSQFGQIVLQTIPGNHFSMMVSPNVQVLGKQIGRSLVLHQAK